MVGPNFTLEAYESACAMARGQGIGNAAQLIGIQIPTERSVDGSAEAKNRGTTIDRNALK